MAVIFDFCLHLENVSLFISTIGYGLFVYTFNPSGEQALMLLVCSIAGSECQNYTHRSSSILLKYSMMGHDHESGVFTIRIMLVTALIKMCPIICN